VALVALGCADDVSCPTCDGSSKDDLQDKRAQTIYGSGFDLVSCDQITEQDVYELCLRIRDRDPQEFEAVVVTNKFHQHLGPNNIYGTKMALYAMGKLGSKPHQMKVLSEAGLQVPMSCLNDGIMVGAGATYGRGLITNVSGKIPKLAATFLDGGKLIRLEVKPEKLKISQDAIKTSLLKHGGLTDEYFKDVRKMALQVWETFDRKDLFLQSTELSGLPFCEHSAHNLRRYENRLYDFLLTGPEEPLILAFIDEDPCVENGKVETKPDQTLVVQASWRSNNQLVELTF
jgi:formylmethanofuran dehydrogenase subunit E